MLPNVEDHWRSQQWRPTTAEHPTLLQLHPYPTPTIPLSPTPTIPPRLPQLSPFPATLRPPPRSQPHTVPSYAPPPPRSQPHTNYGLTPSYTAFPVGTHPDVIRSFETVDRDHSGFIEDKELQQALSSGYQEFSLRTIRLLVFLFKNPSESSLRIGPKEFAALWSCLGQWRATFERFDRDRSGKIDATELRDALYSLGYMVPPSVLQFLVSRYDGGNRRAELNFDSFVECGMIVKVTAAAVATAFSGCLLHIGECGDSDLKGLTEKFKEKDPRYTGSATLNYDEFLSMIIPFLVSY